MIKICGIYGWNNIVDNKWYVGQSVNIIGRRKSHAHLFRHKKHPNQHLQRAVDRYGLKNFKFHIIEEAPEDGLDQKEREWIAKYNACDPQFGYNLASGGKRHKRHSPITKKKISEAKTGVPLSEAHAKAIAEAHKNNQVVVARCKQLGLAQRGQTRSNAVRKNMSTAASSSKLAQAHRKNLAKLRKGVPRSEETKRKLALANLGKKLSLETRKKMSEAHRRRNAQRAVRAGDPQDKFTLETHQF